MGGVPNEQSPAAHWRQPPPRMGALPKAHAVVQLADAGRRTALTLRTLLAGLPKLVGQHGVEVGESASRAAVQIARAMLDSMVIRTVALMEPNNDRHDREYLSVVALAKDVRTEIHGGQLDRQEVRRRTAGYELDPRPIEEVLDRYSTDDDLDERLVKLEVDEINGMAEMALLKQYRHKGRAHLAVGIVMDDASEKRFITTDAVEAVLERIRGLAFDLCILLGTGEPRAIPAVDGAAGDVQSLLTLPWHLLEPGPADK